MNADLDYAKAFLAETFRGLRRHVLINEDGWQGLFGRHATTEAIPSPDPGESRRNDQFVNPPTIGQRQLPLSRGSASGSPRSRIPSGPRLVAPQGPPGSLPPSEVTLRTPARARAGSRPNQPLQLPPPREE